MKRRLRPLAAIAAALGVAAFLGAPAASVGKPDDDVPARLLVTAREYSLVLSRPKIEAGNAIIQMYDYGEDPHDLVIQRVGGNRVWTTGEVLPEETGEIRLRLKRKSSYRLWCSLADHAARGMEATLRTKKR